MTKEQQLQKRLNEIVTDDELEKAWGNANFGSVSKREVIVRTLIKVAQAWHCGFTSICILLELELITKRNETYGLTDKGLEYLLSSVHEHQISTLQNL